MRGSSAPTTLARVSRSHDRSALEGTRRGKAEQSEGWTEGFATLRRIPFSGRRLGYSERYPGGRTIFDDIGREMPREVSARPAFCRTLYRPNKWTERPGRAAGTDPGGEPPNSDLDGW
jgi:hypothetical protein